MLSQRLNSSSLGAFRVWPLLLMTNDDALHGALYSPAARGVSMMDESPYEWLYDHDAGSDSCVRDKEDRCIMELQRPPSHDRGKRVALAADNQEPHLSPVCAETMGN